MIDTTLTALRALAEPTRLRLLALCRTGEHTVSDMVQVLGQSQPRVSRHLKLMCEAGLLERSREGTFVYYRRSTSSAKTWVDAVLDSLPQNDHALSLDRLRLAEIRQERAHVAAEYFHQNAANWHTIRAFHVDEAEVESALISMLPEDIDGELVDIGTGTGRILEVLSPFIARGIGMDQSRAMLAVARAKLESGAIHNARVQQADMYRLPLANQSADIVTLHQVLHYAEVPSAVFSEAARILRLGGRFIVVDFAPHKLTQLQEEHAHIRLGFGDEDIEKWANEVGMEVTTVKNLPGEKLTVVLWQIEHMARFDMSSMKSADMPS